MNLNELEVYKKTKIQEIDHFLRGVYLENIGRNGEKGKSYEIIIENFITNGKFIDLDFINTNKAYRTVVEEALINIKSYRTEVIHTGIEMSTSKEEVDEEVSKFIKNIMTEMTNLKEKILDKFYREKNTKKDQTSLLDTNLNMFNVKLGEKNNNQENSEMEIDDIRNILAYIVSLPYTIKDKKDKLQEIHNLILNNYETGTIPYMQVINHYGKMYKERNYQKFIEEYNDIIKRFFSGNVNSEEKPKSRS